MSDYKKRKGDDPDMMLISRNKLIKLQAENKELRIKLVGNEVYTKVIETENKLLRECVEFVKLDMKHTLYYSGIHKGKQTWFLARNINEKARNCLKEIDKCVCDERVGVMHDDDVSVRYK